LTSQTSRRLHDPLHDANLGNFHVLYPNDSYFQFCVKPPICSCVFPSTQHTGKCHQRAPSRSKLIGFLQPLFPLDLTSINPSTNSSPTCLPHHPSNPSDLRFMPTIPAVLQLKSVPRSLPLKQLEVIIITITPES
jgi:hypothetical protein